MTQDEKDREAFEANCLTDIDYLVAPDCFILGRDGEYETQTLQARWEGFHAAIKLERNRNKWIPVSEGLPEELASVICGWADGTIHLGYLYRGAWFNRATQHFWHHHPTHWQELPAAPKGDQT